MNVKRAIGRASVVSFDIFDTLLLRPYVNPTDLFLHMERAYGKTFFQNVRVTAERNARRASPHEDVTLDEIYAQIDAQFQDMRQRELDWEEMVLRPNLEMRQIWNMARAQGKKIVVASDMYLPHEFLARVLAKNGFGDYDKLYVSGDLGKTKSTGTMFDQIIRDMGVAPHKILHIGDNKRADYKNPRRRGIRAWHYPHVTHSFIKSTPRFDKFNFKNPENLGASILIATTAARQHNARHGGGRVHKNYWDKLGYEYAGPVIYGYTRFIQRVVKRQNLKHLIFVARDGYTLQRVFKTFDSDIDNSYIYAPRFLNLICRLDYSRDDIKQSGAIIDYFVRKNDKIARAWADVHPTSWRDYHQFIQSHQDDFVQCAQIERQNYQNYLLRNAKSTDAVGIVDTITARFSSQKLIEHTLDTPTTAIYWSVLKYEFEGVYTYQEFIHNNGDFTKTFTKNWEFMEFLMTAPEYPIKNLTADGEPIYDTNPTPAEKFRKQVYPDISQGALDFANDIKDLFNGHDIYLTAPTLISYVNCLVDYPTKTDMDNMVHVKHAYDSAHSDYRPLFSVKIPFGDVIRHPYKSMRVVRNALWRTPLQTLFMCLVSPIKIKMRGIKQIRILLLSKLKYNYVNVMVRFSRHCLYQVCVGKPKDVQK